MIVAVGLGQLDQLGLQGLYHHVLVLILLPEFFNLGLHRINLLTDNKHLLTQLLTIPFQLCNLAILLLPILPPHLFLLLIVDPYLIQLILKFLCLVPLCLELIGQLDQLVGLLLGFVLELLVVGEQGVVLVLELACG